MPRYMTIETEYDFSDDLNDRASIEDITADDGFLFGTEDTTKTYKGNGIYIIRRIVDIDKLNDEELRSLLNWISSCSSSSIGV